MLALYTYISFHDQGGTHPHLVAFTPKGNLLSYNQSQPDTIKVWPKVESLWTLSDIESERNLMIEDASHIDRCWKITD